MDVKVGDAVRLKSGMDPDVWYEVGIAGSEYFRLTGGVFEFTHSVVYERIRNVPVETRKCEICGEAAVSIASEASMRLCDTHYYEWYRSPIGPLDDYIAFERANLQEPEPHTILLTHDERQAVWDKGKDSETEGGWRVRLCRAQLRKVVKWLETHKHGAQRLNMRLNSTEWKKLRREAGMEEA